MLTQTIAMKEPATASWGLSVSNADLEKLKAGFQPKDQDDKWHYYVSTTESLISVHVARSAFNIEFYVLDVIVKPDDEDGSGGRAEIASITWETSRGCLSEEEAKNSVVGITRSVLGCDFEAIPEYD